MKTTLEGLTARQAWIYSFMLAGIGSIIALLGALLVVRSAFGNALFVAGLALHLIGIAVCLSAIGVNTARNRLSRPIPETEMAATRLNRLHGARFRGETQVVRMILALILVVYSILCLWLTARNLNELFVLHREGRTCIGQIFNKEREVELGNARTGLVYYSFRVEGVAVTGRFRAARADYGMFRTGRHLVVTYLPGAPRIHRLGLVDKSRAGLESAATLLLVLCGGLYVVGPTIAIECVLRRELHLARCGVIITGMIAGSKPVYRGGKRIGHFVRYEFTIPECGTFRGGARIGQVDGEPTVIGFPITILYDPVRPEHHRPLVAFHRISFNGLQKSLLAA